LCGGGEKKGLVDFQILCSRIYNFWELLIIIDERQKPANEARMGKWHAFASTLKSKGCVHAVFSFSLVSRPLLFISSKQQSPKVVDPVAQKCYWKSTRPFFLCPHTKRKKAV